jgi:hypothetical protein
VNALIVILCALASLSGCHKSRERVSDDAIVLRNLIETDLPMNSVRWEVFSTPEYDGRVPGPTDYVTLIAVIEPVDSEKFQSRSKEGKVWVAPGAVRPWLDEGFRWLLTKYRNHNMDLSGVPNCRKLQGRLRRAARPIEGFVCNAPGKSLIYLTLSDNTGRRCCLTHRSHLSPVGGCGL